MQSEDGVMNLLPALPDVWKDGSISGLRARGGFEILNMQWKGGKLIKLVIKSNLGGNLRLRAPNEIKMSNNLTLHEAKGNNVNPFYQTEEIATPIISPDATVILPKLRSTWLYDISTKPGEVYRLGLKE